MCKAGPQKEMWIWELNIDPCKERPNKQQTNKMTLWISIGGRISFQTGRAKHTLIIIIRAKWHRFGFRVWAICVKYSYYMQHILIGAGSYDKRVKWANIYSLTWTRIKSHNVMQVLEIYCMILAYKLAYNWIREDKRKEAGREVGFCCSCKSVLIRSVLHHGKFVPALQVSDAEWETE